MIATILIAINLYFTYKLAEFSGAIATKRNSMTEEVIEEMRGYAQSKEDNRG